MKKQIKKVSQQGELALLKKIRKRFQPKRNEVIKSIGDDCAVLDRTDKKLLVTTDALNEGIHFDRSYTSPYSLGFKIVSVNVSDIFASGGEPVAIFLSLSLPNDTEEDFFWDFYHGLAEALDIYNLDLLGGDLCASKNDISISATVIGYTDKPIYRTGAKEGDLICVTGNIGLSAMGLNILQSLDKSDKNLFSKIRRSKELVDKKIKFIKDGIKSVIGVKSVMPFINRHLMPIARNSKDIIKIANSMIDLSDGLYIDLQRLCKESKVGAKIYIDKLPISREMIDFAKIFGLDATNIAISGGEDFELLFTISRDKDITRVNNLEINVIGEITNKGFQFIDSEGKSIKIHYKGYEHFSQ